MIVPESSTGGLFSKLSCQEVFLKSLVTSLPEGVQGKETKSNAISNSQD